MTAGLLLTDDERELVDNVRRAYPIRIDFHTTTPDADDAVGDIDIVWEFDHLDAGWYDAEDARAAADAYGCELRIVGAAAPAAPNHPRRTA